MKLLCETEEVEWMASGTTYRLMEKEETKTEGNNGMNGRNHAAYVSHPCQDEGLPAGS